MSKILVKLTLLLTLNFGAMAPVYANPTSEMLPGITAMLACDESAVLPAKHFTLLLMLAIVAHANDKMVASVDQYQKQLSKIQSCEEGQRVYQAALEMARGHGIEYERDFLNTPMGQETLRTTVETLKEHWAASRRPN